ncbi:hypothetical protein ABT039_22665 [Streptomyces lasiicapitis]|uniref:hypothetical protein n=1 Tax=Streptomyces lasiicapitis TaxID=1923961 RepID=UPI00332EBE5E
MSGGHSCVHCRTPTAEPSPEPARHAPVQLPSRPRRFRVHSPGRAPQDCTLHPSGTITRVMAGQLWVSGLSFDDMLERDWAAARIEWDPDEPQPGDPARPPAPTYEETPGW